nr:precorrin-3B synthase [Nostoc sp. FACHB-110]
MLSVSTPCPGLFYATPAKDGILSRIRIPGGILNSKQCRAIASIADMYGGYVDVTNRANLQIREINQGINTEVLQQLQDLGLGSRNPMIDHIRNIMTSPTAGIDPQELIDTRPFVQAWDDYLAAHSELAGLSAKFSVCFDGGGLVSVCDRLNDILFAAVLIENHIYFRLHLGLGEKRKPPNDVGILVSPDECLFVLAALADVYLAHIDTSIKRKPRLREVINNLGCHRYLEEVEQRLPFAGKRDQKLADVVEKKTNFSHIGIHSQRQKNLFYIGVVLPLGRLKSQQIRGLADLAQKYGSGTIRLTPWQNLLITDIPQQCIVDVQSEITDLGLDFSTNNIKSALVSCSGKSGCAASATDTKAHALTLSDYIQTHVKLDSPINIHFSGCEKSCAQHHHSDIALVGVSDRNLESYHIYVGDGNSDEKFGRQLYQNVTFEEVPTLIETMLKVYKSYRCHPEESFGQFTNRYTISQLKQLFFQPLNHLRFSAVCN